MGIQGIEILQEPWGDELLTTTKLDFAWRIKEEGCEQGIEGLRLGHVAHDLAQLRAKLLVFRNQSLPRESTQ